MNNITVKNNLLMQNLKQYVFENKYIFELVAILFFIVYGRQMYVINARIDTEVVINNPSDVYNWLDIGRQGGIFTRLLFEQLNFNPYFATTLSFIILIIGMIIFSYLLYYVGDIKSSISTFIYITFFIHPIWVEQFYFTLQVLEIAVAILCTIISVLLSFIAITENKNSMKLVSIILIIWAFSTYQLFMILFISLSIFSFILFYRKLYLDRKDNYICIKLIIQLILLFIISVLINNIITKMFFSNGAEYLTEQVRWGKDPINICIANVFNHIISVITGQGVFYSRIFIVSLIFAVVCLIYESVKMKNIKYKYLYILALIGLQTAPFLLTIYGATIPVYRAQFVLPFIIACNLGFILIVVRNFKYIKFIAYLLCLSSIITQTQVVMRMQYTDDIRFQEDMRLGSDISNEILMITGGKDKPIAFVGVKKAELNPSCIRGELIGMSIFDANSEVQPHYLTSSDRICNLLKTMGINMRNVSEEQMYEARKIAYSMPVWPNNGSIIDSGEFVIVKLSEDIWYADDILDSTIEKLDISNINLSNNKLKWSVDENIINGNQLKISGWIINPNVSSSYFKPRVYIYNEKDNEFFRLPTIKKERLDLNNACPNEEDYTDSGYIAKGDISNIINGVEDFRIILEYSNDDESIYIDTGIYIK